MTDLRPWFRRWLPLVPNHRGKAIDVWLGVAMVSGAVAAIGVGVAADLMLRGAPAARDRRLAWCVAGVGIVFAAGLIDDLRPIRSRGLMAQLRLAAHGRVTSGVLKMGLILLASWLVPWMLGVRGLRLAVAIPLLAGAANLWNLLDVVPGRALKAFLPTAVVLLALGPAFPVVVLLAAFAGGAAVALPVDLAESSMLGDAGANVLGFVVGVGLLERRSLPAMVVVSLLLVGLHVLAETVTLSRIIRSTAPLRWLDDLGRVLPTDPGEATSSKEVSSST